MSCITYFNNDTSGLQVYVSGTTCGLQVTAVTLNYGQAICMDNDFEIITCGNAEIGAQCLPPSTPTQTPTISLTPSVSKSPTPTPSVTSQETQTPTPTQTQTQTPTPSVTIGLTPTQTETQTSTPTPTPTGTSSDVTPTPTTTQTQTPTGTISVTPTQTPTNTSTPTPSATGNTVSIFIDNNNSLDIPITGMLINGVNVTFVSGTDFTITAGNNGDFSSDQLGTYTVEINYGSHVPGQNIVFTDSNNNVTCKDLNGSSGSFSIPSSVISGGTTIYVVASDGACV